MCARISHGGQCPPYSSAGASLLATSLKLDSNLEPGRGQARSYKLPAKPPLWRDGPSEAAAERELEAFHVMTVALLLAERNGVADDQGADRRLPLQRDAGRGAQLAGVEMVVVLEHVADVGEQRHARGVDVLQERQRQEQLRATEYLERAAHRDRVVIGAGHFARTQGVGLETAHVMHTADRKSVV